MQRPRAKREWWPIAIGIAAVLLTAVVITLGSFRAPLQPEQVSSFSIFLALIALIVMSLLVFAMILGRYLLRLGAERRSGQLGSRFKVRMVLGAMGVSLLPVVFLFFFSYALINRTLNLWFPRPLEVANEESQALLSNFEAAELDRLSQLAANASINGSPDIGYLTRSQSADAWWLADNSGKVESGAELAKTGSGRPLPAPQGAAAKPFSPEPVQATNGPARVWNASGRIYLAGSAAVRNGILYVARRLPDDFAAREAEIKTQTGTYIQLRQQLRNYKRVLLLVLLFITLMLLFVTTWVALFLSKQVTVPIQALAEGTREISRGNFDHRVTTQAQDELGTLVRSFNRMTEQLGEGRRQINEFTRNLELAVEEREQRRKMMEAILENIPTGVISLNSAGEVTRVNPAVTKILGDHAREARTLPELLGEEATRTVMHLMRRSLRMGAASREIEIAGSGRLARTAVTVSSLGPRRSNPGFVVVVDDLTELLQAQKAAAWQEVAQRIAHEIKNPLTPIQISAQRLLRYLDRSAKFPSGAPATEFEKLAAECAGLIEREVATLGSLVDEFSKFARFPAARLVPADVNAIVESALALFQGRLEGIQVQTELAASLPQVRADAELIRRVLVNLIDNAAEAMEGSAVRELRVATRAGSDGDAVEIEISDSGHGISPADKERLFLPQFSTKNRGTGLGLAIANRIVAEHNGAIRVADNQPAGSRFVIRFPAIEVAAATRAAN